MTRFNYRQSAFERIVGRRPQVAVNQQMRSALIAAGAALLLVAAVDVIEVRRVAGLDAQRVALADRIAAAQRADAHVDALARSVAHLRAVREAVLASRRDAVIAANDIARIGNELPPETWLTSVQEHRAGGWSIAGRSTRVDQIGSTLSAIGRMDPAATARLVSINATGKRGEMLDFIIAWDRPQ